MKNRIKALVALVLISSLQLKADEGMWMPLLLKKYNYEKMKAMGLKLTPEQLYDVNNSSLKDAIVWFNGGCTGEIISDQGLVLTNHHCGYDAIASLSTPQDNILDNGFWAKSFAEERPKPGMWVSIVQRMDDVTDKVMSQLQGVAEKDRPAKLQAIYKQLTDEAVKGTHYEAQVREMFKGNAYYLFVFEKFTDIRLVGTPPQSIGKFGGDPDNWVWPRHTGDFSMFRIYAGKDGKPAKYSADNVPYKPKHSLPVSIKGIKDGDYAMVYGFPGRTNRYEFSNGIQLAQDKVNPTIVALRDIRLKAWKEVMDKSEADRLLLSGTYASIANYWKYFIGQTEQLKRLKVYEGKVADEKKFTDWAKGKGEFETVLPNVQKAYDAYIPFALQRTYLSEGLFGIGISGIAFSMYGYETAKDTASANKVIAMANQNIDAFYEEFFAAADEKIMRQILLMYYNNIPKEQQAPYMATILKKGKTPEEAINKFAAEVYAKSLFANKEKFKAFLAKPNAKSIAKDPAYAMVKSFYENYLNNYKPKVDEFNAAVAKEGRAYVKGLMEMNPTKTFYPDANSSLRLTYGSVQGYEPKDAVKYDYITTLDGVVEKHNPKDFEFNAPQRLLDLYNAKNFGQYALPNGKLPVAFITNNDITGGNSGSPVINGEGQLIGLAFDGNWEAMSGDIVFDEKYKRTINVDIRYVLFLIDKYGQAENIINEMKIVR
ncbi:MAG: S46 family peptidase [Bacteroidia bacterium]|jgi:hypothetical protein|nr:S46 family peptidase [Bacteroidia bacterium]